MGRSALFSYINKEHLLTPFRRFLPGTINSYECLRNKIGPNCRIPPQSMQWIVYVIIVRMVLNAPDKGCGKEINVIKKVKKMFIA